jgi:nucleoside 2-deoxyribosyltransferase
MRRIASVYLSGPAALSPKLIQIAGAKRDLCQRAGFDPLTPLDDVTVETEATEVMARELYAARVARMRAADAAILDLTPRAGPSCDTDTAFEAGFLAGLGKPVFAYLNVTSRKQALWRARRKSHFGADGGRFPDFGLPESLMIWAEARRTFIVVTSQPELDLTGLVDCLEALLDYAD